MISLHQLLLREDIPEDAKLIIGEEITAQNAFQAERELFKTKKRLETLINSHPAVIYSCVPDGNHETIYISEKVKEVLGYDPKNFINRPDFWEDNLHPDDEERCIASVRKVFENEYYSEEYRFKNKEGTYQWMMDEANLIRDDRGNPLEIVGFWTDITRRKQAELALRESEAQFRIIAETSVDIIYQADLDGTIVYISPAVERILGYTPDQAVGRHFSNFMSPDEAPRATEDFKKIIISGETGRFVERQLIHKKGNPITVEINLAPIIKNGKPQGSLGILRDITERKIIEHALKESEEKFRSLAEESSNMIWLNKRGKIVYANKKSKEIIGYKRQEIYSSNFNFLTLIAPEYIEKIKSNFSKHMNGEDIGPLEYAIISKDGTRIDVLGTTKLIDFEGEKAILGITTDITKLKKVELALRESEQRYRMLFESSPISLWEEDFSDAKQYLDILKARGIKDLRYYLDTYPEEVKKLANMVRIIDVNNSTLKLYNAKTKEEFLEGLGVFFNEQAYDVFKDEILALYNGETMFESEYPGFKLTGEPIDAVVTISVVPGFEENLLRIIVSVVDVTKLKQVENAHRESEERLRAFMDSVTDPIELWDSNFCLVDCNQAVIDAFPEVSVRDDIIGKNIAELIPDIKESGRYDKYVEVIKTGKPFFLESFIPHPKFGEKYYSVQAFKVGNGIGMINRDVTDRKKAENIRLELEKRRENFIYMASHEIRTPLTVIAGYCDFLRKHDEFIDPSRRNKIYSVMRSNIDRLERLSKDVAQIAHIQQTGQFKLTKTDISLCSFLNTSLTPYKHLLEDQFTFQGCEREELTISADPGRLQQVLENLIDNAIKHTSKEHRKIIVTVEVFLNEIRINIEDNGAGINTEHLEAIFDQFVSFDTEYAAGGTGIGLYLSRKIMEAHGGTIVAQSKGKGQGASFVIQLPLHLD
ncbi:MAG: PAS domain S-box protein [Promethearchaeota archaeon]